MRKGMNGKRLFAHFREIVENGQEIGMVGGNGGGKRRLLNIAWGEDTD